MALIRWILVLPAALFGIVVAIVSAFILAKLLPSNCVDICEWSVMIVLPCCLASILFIVFGVLVAPRIKQQVVWGLYLLGGFIAALTCFNLWPWEERPPDVMFWPDPEREKELTFAFAAAVYGSGLICSLILSKHYGLKRQLTTGSSGEIAAKE